MEKVSRTRIWTTLVVGAVALLLIIPAYFNTYDSACEKAFSEHIYLTLPIRKAIEEHWFLTNRFPASWGELSVDHDELGMPAGSSVELGQEGRLTITMGNECEKYAGDTIELTPGVNPNRTFGMQWACSWGGLARNPCAGVLAGPFRDSTE